MLPRDPDLVRTRDLPSMDSAEFTQLDVAWRSLSRRTRQVGPAVLGFQPLTPDDVLPPGVPKSSTVVARLKTIDFGRLPISKAVMTAVVAASGNGRAVGSMTVSLCPPKSAKKRSRSNLP